MNLQYLHIGTKVIQAEAMTRQAYNDLRGWQLPKDEDGTDQGYLVEYLDGGKANHPDYKGYISWSPKEVFDNAYNPNGSFNFGDALLLLKQGIPMARKGWNGKGQFVAYNAGQKDLPADKFWIPANKAAAEANGGTMDVAPYLSLKTAQNTVQMGWVPSTGDLLAEDWEIYNS